MPKIREVSEDNKAERQAVNSIIQGTASDVVKMAMIGIERAIVLQEKKEAAERKERRMRKLSEKEKEKEKEEKGKETAKEETEEKEKKKDEEENTRKGKEVEKGKERRTKEGDSPPSHDLDELLAIEEQMMAEAEQENNEQREREAEKPSSKKEERKEEKEKEKEEAEEKEEREAEAEAEEKAKKGYSAALLLQIHDELVYEVRDDMIDWIEDVILDNMEGIQIPVTVDDEPKKEGEGEGEAGGSQTRQIVFPVRLFLGSRFGSMRSFPLKPANLEERYRKKSKTRSNTNTEAAPPSSRGGIGEEQASDMILEDWFETKQP